MKTKLFYYSEQEHLEKMQHSKALSSEQEGSLFNLLDSKLNLSSLTTDQARCLKSYIEGYKNLRALDLRIQGKCATEHDMTGVSGYEQLPTVDPKDMLCQVEDAIQYLSLSLEDSHLSNTEIEEIQNWINYYQHLDDTTIFRNSMFVSDNQEKCSPENEKNYVGYIIGKDYSKSESNL